MKPRLLVTGGAGFLGTHILKQSQNFLAIGTLHQTAATAIPGVSFHVCDLQKPQEVRILLDRARPDIIIHTACSDQGENLSAIVPVAGLLAIQAAERHIKFIHLSTDQVFDGTAAPYTEASPTCPIHPYGEAKAQAEELIRSLNPQATIIRTSLLYDLENPDRQTNQLMHRIDTGASYRLFIDEWRCPMWVKNVANALLELATADHIGLLHLGGPQVMNRWELGMELLKHFCYTPTPNIQQGTIEESGLVRPKNLTLDSTQAQQLLHTPFLSLPESLTQFTTLHPHA